MAIKEFLHISIGISDPEKSVPFYRDILGFKVIRSTTYKDPGPDKVMDVGDSEFTVWLMTNGTFRLELIHYAHPKAPPLSARPKMHHLGLSHLTLGVDDARATMEELKAKGVKVLEHTYGSFEADNPNSMFLFEDPDGFLVEAFTMRPSGELPYS